MICNIEISAEKEPLMVLLRRVMLLYTVDAMRATYTQLKLLDMAKEGPEQFAEVAMRGADFTEEEQNMVMEAFLNTLQIQASEIQRDGQEWRDE